MTERPWRTPAIAAAIFGGFWATAFAANWFLDTPYYYQGRPNWSNDLVTSATRFLTRAESVLSASAFVFLVPAILVMAVYLARRTKIDPLERWFRREDAERTAVVLAATCATIAASIVAFLIVRHADILDDEYSYLFQARLFAQGKIGLPSPPDALRDPMLLLRPMWTSIYPPGHSMLLAIGSLLHEERLVPPVLAAIMVIAAWSFARDAFGPKHGALAAVLMGASPFVWAVHGTVMAISTTATCGAVFLAAVARAERTGKSAWCVVGGAVVGLAFISRPYEAVAFAAPFAIRFSWEAFRGVDRARARFATYAIGFVSVAWLLLAHDKLVTGNLFKMPWQLEPAGFKLGFTHSLSIAPDFVHTPASAIGNLVAVVLRLDLWALGFPCSLLLVVAGLLRRDATRYDRMLRQGMLGYVALYLLVPFPGTSDVGPTYYYALMPLIVPLAVRGVHWLRASVAEDVFGSLASRASIGWAVVCGVVVSVCAVTPMRAINLSVLTREIRAPWDVIEGAPLEESIVVVPPIEQRMAPGWSHGHPYLLESALGKPIHLISPHTATELADARAYLGPSLPLYVLALDVPQYRVTGRRTFKLLPFDPTKATTAE